MKDEDKTIMRRLGFLPQAKPRYHVKYEVFPDRLECRTTCPDCLTAINFVIHGQTKRWTTRYISLSIQKALNDNHTTKCQAIKSQLNLKTHFADVLRGDDQRQERALRVQRGQEPPNMGRA